MEDQTYMFQLVLVVFWEMIKDFLTSFQSFQARPDLKMVETIWPNPSIERVDKISFADVVLKDHSLIAPFF